MSESAEVTLDPSAAVAAAFAVAVTSYRAINRQTPKRGFNVISGMDHTRTVVNKRRRGLLSRWLTQRLGGQA